MILHIYSDFLTWPLKLCMIWPLLSSLTSFHMSLRFTHSVLTRLNLQFLEHIKFILVPGLCCYWNVLDFSMTLTLSSSESLCNYHCLRVVIFFSFIFRVLTSVCLWTICWFIHSFVLYVCVCVCVCSFLDFLSFLLGCKLHESYNFFVTITPELKIASGCW